MNTGKLILSRTLTVVCNRCGSLLSVGHGLRYYGSETETVLVDPCQGCIYKEMRQTQRKGGDP